MAKKNVRFIRRGGRVIPIAIKSEMKAGKSLLRHGKGEAAKVAGSAALVGGSLYGAGRLFKLSKGAGLFGTLAKTLKYGGVATAGMIAVSSLNKLDKKVSDEQSIFRVGGKSAANIATQLAGGYVAYRFGKKFEKAGKLGLNLFKKSSWAKLKHIRDI